VNSGFKIVPLDKSHKREDFQCNDEPVLEKYLKQLAGQDAKKNLARIYVAMPESEMSRILGFYTLSMAHLMFEELPVEVKKNKYPESYQIPVARLGRLAVDSRSQKQGIGEALLMNALCRALQISEAVGAVGVVVDAKHEKAKAFYQKYGFVELTTKPLTLLILMGTIKNACGV
jgi:GNAT superfamily N-acetyltransferase